MVEIVTVAQQQTRRAELVKQRAAIDSEIGEIDIRLALGASPQEVEQFFQQAEQNARAPQPEVKREYPPAARTRIVLAAILLIVLSASVHLLLAGYWRV